MQRYPFITAYALPWRCFTACVWFTLLLSGCSTASFYVHVTTFCQPNFVPVDKEHTFAFVRKKAQVQSLAHKHIEALLIPHLAAYRFVEVPPSTAQYLIQVSYAVDKGKTVTRIDPTIRFWQWQSLPGSLYYPQEPMSYRLTLLPECLIDRYPTYTETLYTHRLHIDIYDQKTYRTKNFAKLYESSAMTQHTTDNFFVTAPALVQALFTPFPAENGKISTVRITLPRQQK
jgi:hypothetical protein